MILFFDSAQMKVRAALQKVRSVHLSITHPYNMIEVASSHRYLYRRNKPGSRDKNFDFEYSLTTRYLLRQYNHRLSIQNRLSHKDDPPHPSNYQKLPKDMIRY